MLNISLIIMMLDGSMPVAYSAPAADFTVSQRPGSLAVDFVANNIGGASSYNCDWTFGDLNVASGRSVTHTYATAGTYSVTLRITNIDNGSDSSTHVQTVTVSSNSTTATSTPTPTPVPSATPTPTPGANVTLVAGLTSTPTSQPTVNTTAAGSSGGFNLSGNMLQLAMAGIVALIIAAGAIYFISGGTWKPGSGLKNRPPKQDIAPKAPKEKKSSKPAPSLQIQRAAPQKNLGPAPSPGPDARPAKSKEDLSQDYLYGLVMGIRGEQEKKAVARRPDGRPVDPAGAARQPPNPAPRPAEKAPPQQPPGKQQSTIRMQDDLYNLVVGKDENTTDNPEYQVSKTEARPRAIRPENEYRKKR